MPPGHDLTHYYALIPLLTVLAILDPPALEALATAVGIVASFKQLH